MRISRKLPRRTSTGFFLLIKLYHYAESANHFDSMPEEFTPGYEFAVRTGKVFVIMGYELCDRLIIKEYCSVILLD